MVNNTMQITKLVEEMADELIKISNQRDALVKEKTDLELEVWELKKKLDEQKKETDKWRNIYMDEKKS